MPAAGASYNCDAVGSLWGGVNTMGVKAGVPYITFDDLMNGSTVAQAGGALDAVGGTNFKNSWNSPNSKAAFDAMAMAVNGDGSALNPGLPKPVIPSFAAGPGTNLTPCDVLVTAGALPAGSCP
jgi:hypothetical protein